MESLKQLHTVALTTIDQQLENQISLFVREKTPYMIESSSNNSDLDKNIQEGLIRVYLCDIDGDPETKMKLVRSLWEKSVMYCLRNTYIVPVATGDNNLTHLGNTKDQQ